MECEEDNHRYLARLQSAPELPVRTLVATAPLSADDAPDDYPVDDYNRLWTEHSAAFLDLSKRAQRVLVEGSGHLLQLERPDVVLESVLETFGEVEALEAQRAAEDA
jgi:pimeloyl-ACP methyl ester carboxylesterase